MSRDGVRLSRQRPGAPRRRGDPPDHPGRPSSSSWPTRSPTTGADFGAGRRKRSRPGPGRSRGPPPAATAGLRPRGPGPAVADGALHDRADPRREPGEHGSERRTWVRSTGTPTPAGVLDIMRQCRWAGRPAASGSSHRRRSTSSSRSAGERHGRRPRPALAVRHRLRARPSRQCPTCRKAGSASGVAPVADPHGPQPAADAELHHEPDGAGHHRRPSAAKPCALYGALR